MGIKSVALAVSTALAVIACSSRDATSAASASASSSGSGTTTTDGGGTSGPVDPATKCTELAGIFCDRAVSCNPSDAGSPAEQRASCGSTLEGALNCPAATAIAESYPACVKELPQVECAKFASTGADVLPQSCKGVVQAPAAPAPPGPETKLPAVTKPNMILGRATSKGGYDVYLGCLCDDVDPDSVTNAAGTYGPQSKFSASSIWNRFGTFGSDFSSQSSCNQFALDPPVVVNNGQIVGRLTRNQFAPGAITDPAVVSFLSGSVCVN